MRVSRREFVSIAGCAAAASLCALPASAFAVNDSSASAEGDCTLLNLESNCALTESFDGMHSALGSSRRRITVSELPSFDLPGVVIVAAAGSVSPETFTAVAESIKRGARVVWESGAAFLNSDDFEQQKYLTKRHFEISIARPIDVWPQANSRKSKPEATIQGARSMRAIGHHQIPYITYRWPHEAHVRDFSRVLPVSAANANGQAIAHWGKVPVALSTKLGAGTLVFLGSPLGPALHAGDPEAHRLFQSMVA